MGIKTSHHWKLAGVFFTLTTLPSFSQDYACAGSNPNWTLEITGATASFSFVNADSLDIPHISTAKDRDWPKALTLLGGRDTAIVILNKHLCSTAEITNYPIEANILTQNAETPVILTGCCTQP
jgi:hypothetical protein